MVKRLVSYNIVMRINGLFLLLAIVLSVFVLTAQQVQAVLGGPADSIKSDSAGPLVRRHVITDRSDYSIQENVYEGITVREFVSGSGVVFAVAWKGTVRPDLSQLLGSYADEYQAAFQQTPRQKGIRHLQVKTRDIVVEKWGHMRGLQGRAYVPALIPPGVSVDEIR
jgi:hypothetical protein